MSRIISLLPGLLVALSIISLASLYLAATSEVKDEKIKNSDLLIELQKSNANTQEALEKIHELESKLFIAGLNIQEQTKTEFADNYDRADYLPPEKNTQSTEQKKPSSQLEQSIETKIASIAKFVPLSPLQEDRLRNKFFSESNPNNPPAETLDDIIGRQSAEFYREERRKAFERVLQNSIEKEVLFIARRLALDEVQEEALRKIYFEAEELIRAKRELQSDEEKAAKSTMQRLIEEEKLRNKLLTEKVRNILDDSRYDEYITYQSGSQDMQLWHER